MSKQIWQALENYLIHNNFITDHSFNKTGVISQINYSHKSPNDPENQLRFQFVIIYPQVLRIKLLQQGKERVPVLWIEVQTIRQRPAAKN